MRIDRLKLRHFKGFDSAEFSFHPQFNLLVGRNGSGKTSVLNALAVAAGSWFLGIRGSKTRHIGSEEVQLEQVATLDSGHWEARVPCEVWAQGVVQGASLQWLRSINRPGGRTTYGGAGAIKALAARVDEAVRRGSSVELPLIAYYGAGRLWQEPREYRTKSPEKAAGKQEQSRFTGYEFSTDSRLSVSQLTRWVARQSWMAFQKNGQYSPGFKAAKQAIVNCVDGATDLVFDAQYGEVVLDTDTGRQPFSNLSDGQRGMLAMVGDIAQKAARLNPHLEGEALKETPGVVLIDELDLHLHPLWQRRVVEDLRRTFPAIQFICTTHSPFLIQALRSGEELIMLEGQPTADVAHMPVEDIAQGIMGVPNPRVSLRYEQMSGVAKHYLEVLEEAAKAPEDTLEDYKARLAEDIAPYAANPAFQAFLEMQRLAKLGD